jgi:hypothetical protein
MLRSANFTVTLTELLGSAAETALKLEARAPKIAAAIRVRRPVEAVEVFMVISWIVDKGGVDLPGGRGSLGGGLGRPRLGCHAELICRLT